MDVVGKYVCSNGCLMDGVLFSDKMFVWFMLCGCFCFQVVKSLMMGQLCDLVMVCKVVLGLMVIGCEMVLSSGRLLCELLQNMVCEKFVMCWLCCVSYFVMCMILFVLNVVVLSGLFVNVLLLWLLIVLFFIVSRWGMLNVVVIGLVRQWCVVVMMQ